MDCTVLHWAVLGCAGLYWSVLVCTRLNWAVVGCSRLYCGVLGCTGRIQQLFVCVFSHFRLGDEQPNNQPTNQPGDPRASLLLTSVRRQSFAKSCVSTSISNFHLNKISSSSFLISMIIMIIKVMICKAGPWIERERLS